MKKIALQLFIYLCFNPQNFAINNNDKQIEISEVSISKKWIFKDLINPDFTKEEYEETKGMLEAFSLVINKDHTCITSFIMDIEGKWKLNSANKKITIKDERGTTIWTIHSISEKEIIMSRNDAKQKIIFVVDNN